MEKTGLSTRMKGGGGVGIAEGRGEGHTSPTRPYPPGIHPGGETLNFPPALCELSVLCILFSVHFLFFTFKKKHIF